jgi:hypothetical protein
MQPRGRRQPTNHSPARYTTKFVETHAIANRLNRRLPVNRQKNATKSSSSPAAQRSPSLEVDHSSNECSCRVSWLSRCSVSSIFRSRLRTGKGVNACCFASKPHAGKAVQRNETAQDHQSA